MHLHLIYASILLVITYHVTGTWFKHALKEVNCDHADQWKCEDSVLWQAQCPICKKCYNICLECRDRNMACKKHTTFMNPDCKDKNSELYKTCPKACGGCKCNRTVAGLPEECLEHFKRVIEYQKRVKDEL